MEKHVEVVEVSKIRPYEKNPRKNDGAVAAVAESIKQCGYISNIVVDENYTVLCGHTRLKALQQLGEATAEITVVSGLTAAQKKKFRLLDNKTGENAEWDLDLLFGELEGLDFDGFDFGFGDELGNGEVDGEAPEEGEVPFGEILGEENNYIVLQFKTEVDWLQAQSIFGLKTVKSYSTRTDGKISKNMEMRGIGRVLDGAKALHWIMGSAV